MNDKDSIYPIIDNEENNKLNKAIKILSNKSKEIKIATGYFYIDGFNIVQEDLLNLRNSIEVKGSINSPFKIIMGNQTNLCTRDQIILGYKQEIEKISDPNQIKNISNLYRFIQSGIVDIRVHTKKLFHPKLYLFNHNIEDRFLGKKYIIGSSNFSYSGSTNNVELNLYKNEDLSFGYLEEWFDKIWEESDEFKADLIKIIENSKPYQTHRDIFEVEPEYKYIESKEFIKILIKNLKADYLFDEFKKSKLLQFQYVDFIRILNNFNAKDYRGCFVTSSVGLGKSYVASQVAKYFLSNDKKVLIIAPAGLVHTEDQWPRYLKEFDIYGKIDLVSMGDLQKNPDIFRFKKYHHKYGLIIIDEAHNYRNPDTYRTRNLKKIIDDNGDSKILFLTATPINTSLDDLLNLIKLFYRKGQNLLFDRLVRELDYLILLFKTNEYEDLEESEKEKLAQVQEEIEKEMFVKSTRETIKTELDYIKELKEFSGVDIDKLNDPYVNEAKYELDSRYKDIVNGIVDFITGLSASHLRILDPEKGIRLGGMFKWLLYKRFESDISSYYLTLKRLSQKGTMILTAVEQNDTKYLDEDEYEDDVYVTFDMDFKDKLKDVIEKIQSGKGDRYIKVLEELKLDLEKINQQISNLEPYLKEGSEILFKNDQKINQLSGIFDYNKSKKILVFTEYKDTIKAIKEYFKDSIDSEEIRFIDSTTKNKQASIERFNGPENTPRILITTDTLSEGFNISGADLVINFDIPYNPVRIIQRVGRATRLDTPKEIGVINFRPDDDIDVELKLVDKMELRIKDIIRFVGVEYRIWFETEKELLSKRREKDKKIYLDVLQRIRSNMREGKFEKIEVSLNYSKPILTFLQKAIKKYGLNKNEIKEVSIPSGKYYTTFKGDKDFSISYGDGDIFNENILLNKELYEIDKKIDFKSVFEKELKSFENYKNKKKEEYLRMQYCNDKIDKLVNSILDYIASEKLEQLYSDVANLEEALENVKNKCGSTTDKTLKRIMKEIREDVTTEKIIKWTNILEESFTKLSEQKKLVNKKDYLYAIAFLEG